MYQHSACFRFSEWNRPFDPKQNTLEFANSHRDLEEGWLAGTHSASDSKILISISSTSHNVLLKMQKSKNSVPYDRLWNWLTCEKGKVKTSIVFHMAGVFNNSSNATHALELDDRVNRSALLHFPTPFVQISKPNP